MHLLYFEANAIQIDDLRLAIPRIIEPFHRPPNPSTYKLYAQGVVGSQNGLNTFKDQLRQPEMQGAFEHVKRSFAANADLSESVSVPSHDWIERERKAKESTKSKRSESVEEIGAILSDEDMSRIVVEFRKTYPNLKVEDDDHTISVSIMSPTQSPPLTQTIDAIRIRLRHAEVPNQHRARSKRSA